MRGAINGPNNVQASMLFLAKIAFPAEHIRNLHLCLKWRRTRRVQYLWTVVAHCRVGGYLVGMYKPRGRAPCRKRSVLHLYARNTAHPSPADTSRNLKNVYTRVNIDSQKCQTTSRTCRDVRYGKLRTIERLSGQICAIVHWHFLLLLVHC